MCTARWLYSTEQSISLYSTEMAKPHMLLFDSFGVAVIDSGHNSFSKKKIQDIMCSVWDLFVAGWLWILRSKNILLVFCSCTSAYAPSVLCLVACLCRYCSCTSIQIGRLNLVCLVTWYFILPNIAWKLTTLNKEPTRWLFFKLTEQISNHFHQTAIIHGASSLTKPRRKLVHTRPSS